MYTAFGGLGRWGFCGFLVLLCAMATGCRAPRTTAELIGELRNPSPDARRRAASELARAGGPPPEAVPYLLSAVQDEPNSKAIGAMLVALGQSGAPEARPAICAHSEPGDTALHRSASRAARKWMARNGMPHPDSDAHVDLRGFCELAPGSEAPSKPTEGQAGKSGDDSVPSPAPSTI